MNEAVPIAAVFFVSAMIVQLLVETAAAEKRAAGPSAVEVARTRVIPRCSRYVDASFAGY